MVNPMFSDRNSDDFTLNVPDITSKAPVELLNQHSEPEDIDSDDLTDLAESRRRAQQDVYMLFPRCAPESSLGYGAGISEDFRFVSVLPAAADPELIHQPQIWTDEMLELWGDIVQTEGTASDKMVLAASRRAIAMKESQSLEAGVRTAKGREATSREQRKRKERRAEEPSRQEMEKKEAEQPKIQFQKANCLEGVQCNWQSQEFQQEQTEQTDKLDPLTKDSTEIDAFHEAISAVILRYVLGLNPPPALGTPQRLLPEATHCLEQPEHIVSPFRSTLKTSRKLLHPHRTPTMTDSRPGTERVAFDFSDDSFATMEMAIFRLGGGVRLTDETLAGIILELEKLGNSKKDINKFIRWSSKYKTKLLPSPHPHPKDFARKTPHHRSKTGTTVGEDDSEDDRDCEEDGDDQDDEDYQEEYEYDDECHDEERHEEISDGETPAVSSTPPKPSRRAFKLVGVAGKTAEEVIAEIIAGARLAAVEDDYEAAGTVKSARRSVKRGEAGGADKGTKVMKNKAAVVPKYAAVTPSRNRSRKSGARDVPSDEEWNDYVTSGALAAPSSGTRSIKLGSKGMTLEQQMQEIAAQAEREALRIGVSSKRSKV